LFSGGGRDDHLTTSPVNFFTSCESLIESVSPPPPETVKIFRLCREGKYEELAAWAESLGEMQGKS
jgi:hypothetical protein